MFYDDNAVLFDDPEHSEYEERFILLGISASSGLCTVCHCYRESESVIRIISARKQQEQKRGYTMSLTEENTIEMRDEYDVMGLNPRKNPYSKALKKQITININNDTVEYFKREAVVTGIPYQTLINLYLTDCALKERKLNLSWE